MGNQTRKNPQWQQSHQDFSTADERYLKRRNESSGIESVWEEFREALQSWTNRVGVTQGPVSSHVLGGDNLSPHKLLKLSPQMPQIVPTNVRNGSSLAPKLQPRWQQGGTALGGAAAMGRSSRNSQREGRDGWRGFS